MYMKKKWLASQTAMAFAMAAMTVLLAAGCDNGMTGAVAAVVAGQKDVAVESVTIEPDTLTLATGTARKLTATVTPSNATDKTVTWQSSNPSVATVGDDGTVTAVSIGTATIYAQAGDKTTACQVTVRLPDAEAEVFEINDYGTLTKYTGTDADVTIPEGVTSIGYDAFYGCTSLASVTIPEGVTSIGDDAFWWCTSLASVTIPASVTYIGDGAFYGCTSLKEIVFKGTVEQWQAIRGSGSGIPGIRCKDGYVGIKDIPEYLMMNGTQVVGYTGEVPAALVIPDGVTKIGYGAFKGCTSLTSVKIPASVTEIGSGAFDGRTSFETVTYNGTLAQWCAMNNFSCLMGNAKSVILTGENNMDLKLAETLVIPDSVTSIGESAFDGCKNLKSVTIPANVTHIGSYAFDGCTSLESVTIPANVTYIGMDVFYGCTNLKSVEIPEGVTSIGDSMFYGCTSLVSVEIPDSVTYIGGYAFYGCTSLTSVDIPAGVTEIGYGAFWWCTSLASVTYGGTKEDWNGIDKEWGIFSSTKVKEITDKDGNTFQVDKSGNITD
ncbi:MAG: leucine-rich repeat protein [Treponemataceae bacterium]|nr:leucine-rich repeat protein [Treponemataceae bacterium]